MGISNGRFNLVEPKTNSNEVAVDYDSIIATKFTPKSTDTKDNQPRHATAPVMQENCLVSDTERIEQMRSHRQTENNQNTVQPHDTYRPATLLEQFAELFDNEWARAFEYLTKDDSHQEQTVRRLLNILQEIYTKCQECIRKQLEDQNDKTSAYLGVFEEKDSLMSFMQSETSSTLSFLAYTADVHVAGNKAKDQVVIKETETRRLDHRTRNHNISLDHIIKDVRRQLHVQPEGSVHDILEKYIQKCIRICWLMCVISPEMHLDFGVTQIYEGNSDDVNDFPLYFNTTKFVSYTRAGMYVEYVVWPAVYLYKNGPLMKKGVAQGVNIKPEILV